MATSPEPSRRLPAVNTFDDPLARLDAVATIDALDAGDLGEHEVVLAAVERAQKVDPLIGAVMFERYDQALATASGRSGRRRGSFDGMPTFIKDMVPVAGLPSTWGAAALADAPPQKRTRGVARDMERMGMTLLGTSTMPEWGFVPSTEFPEREPTRNPWNTDRTIGGSSGGAAALVAAGVVPVAHAVDGGGSIRIPAACGGLVGLKPTLGRLRRHADERNLPVSISVDGVVSRTVRDIARFHAEMEKVFLPRSMAPMGEVTGPPSRRLRIGVLGEIPGVISIDAPTAATLRSTADLLAGLGHHVEETSAPVEPVQFRDDFIFYYRFLVFAATNTARIAHGSHYDRSKLTKFSQGMAASFRERPGHIVGVSRRLRRVRQLTADLHRRFDVILSPTLSSVPPELGHLGANVDFEPLLERIAEWMPYTPLANAAGTPSITVPMGFDEATHLPVGAMLSADFGADALLLQVALELENAQPWDLNHLA
ncbi:MAG: amidase [Acidimicrobiales bacterium]|nr:amidase [Acidimicrobiales bacterium]